MDIMKTKLFSDTPAKEYISKLKNITETINFYEEYTYKTRIFHKLAIREESLERLGMVTLCYLSDAKSMFFHSNIKLN